MSPGRGSFSPLLREIRFAIALICRPSGLPQLQLLNRDRLGLEKEDKEVKLIPFLARSVGK